MHELGMAKGLWESIKVATEKNKLSKVTKIKLAVGQFSGIDPHFLEHSLKDHVLTGTIAATAVIEIFVDPVKLRCKSCGKVWGDTGKAVMPVVSCTACKSYDIEIMSGKDVVVTSIEGV
ncbi:MAG: hydrogenase maturation nickel metallochaperone HypA [Elusimicrobiota bacterium]